MGPAVVAIGDSGSGNTTTYAAVASPWASDHVFAELGGGKALGTSPANDAGNDEENWLGPMAAVVPQDVRDVPELGFH